MSVSVSVSVRVRVRVGRVNERGGEWEGGRRGEEGSGVVLEWVRLG